MSERLIPNGDNDFVTKLRIFANAVAREPARLAVSDDDAQAMMNAFLRYEESFLEARCGGGRSQRATRAKNAARAEAARLYKRLIGIIKVSDAVDDKARYDVGLRPADGKRRARRCPQEPPVLRFVRALHVGGAIAPMHELKFYAAGTYAKTKPPGATRLELFVDLVPPGETAPDYPGQNATSRPWYLRSYSRSPIRLTPPICRVPMLVVYWARWADAIGNVGPLCATVVSRIEGWTGQGVANTGLNGPKPVRILEDASSPAGPAALLDPAERQHIYRIAVLEAQFQYVHPQNVAAPALTSDPRAARPARPVRQLEGPPQGEAA